LVAREGFDEANLQRILLGPEKPIAVQKVDQVPRLISGKPDYQAASALLAD
jgi:hypothetical protein